MYVSNISITNIYISNINLSIYLQVLSTLVEKSPELRILDLRDNCISSAGAKMLYDSTRKNTSILYVTQRQGGVIIEGHREIIGSGKSAIISEDERREDFERLVGSPKYPLRIDMRNNNPDQEILEEFLESIEVKKKKDISSNQDDNHSKFITNRDYSNMSPRGNTRQKVSSRSPSRRVVRHRSPSPSTSRLRPLSASSRGRGSDSGDFSDNERSNRTNSANGMKISRGRKHNDSDQDSNSDEEDLKPNVIAHIEKRKNNGGRSNGKRDTNDDGKLGGVVGSIIDDQIRQMQENGVGGGTLKKGIAENSPSRLRSPMRASMKSPMSRSSPTRLGGSDNESDSYHNKVSVKERTLTETKSIYSAKLHWPGLDEEPNIVTSVKRPKSASATGRSSGRTVTMTSSTSTNKASKRPQSASSVREKLNVAKEKDNSLISGSSRNMKGGGNKKKLNNSNSASLLESLQKFNPSVLF
jgi:hypothetical protein